MAGLVPSEWWFYIVLGLCAGVVSGTLGVGSGILLVPALVFLAAFGQKSAQGTALAVMVPMTLVGAIRYWRNPDIEISGVVVVWIVAGAVVGALVGTELAGRLSGAALRRVFAVFLVVVAARMFVAAPKPRQTDNQGNQPNRSEMKAVGHGGTDHGTDR